MKRLIIVILCCVIAVLPALAERLVTPTPPPEGFALEIPTTQMCGIGDVLFCWSAQEENQDAFNQLETMRQGEVQSISQEALLRILITYCIEINPDTTIELLMTYTPLIIVQDGVINVTIMTHALGFTITLDAYTGKSLYLAVDENVGNG